MSTVQHQVTHVIGARMQVIEKTLDLIETLRLDPKDNQVEQVHTDLVALVTVMNLHLEHLSEWQVSAFHDQYRVLTNRYVALNNTNLALTKEN